jgi:magnesium chelatase family protein
MLARAHTFILDGPDARRVAVEVDVRRGLPAFTIIGLADAAVREARERVRTAILNSGFEFPARRVTANLAPADLPKIGPGLDLALACALLCATGQLPPDSLRRCAMLGELALDGSLRAVPGVLAIAHAARCAGIPVFMVAESSAGEARLVPGLAVSAVGCLSAAVAHLRGEDQGSSEPGPARQPPRPREHSASQCGVDLSDVRGAEHAVRALVISAAGGHSLLLSGAPGTGKTMLAVRLPTILPPLSATEAIEVARIDSLAGARVCGLSVQPPFRAPHHSVTAAGLVGGARGGSVGEVVRAHNGVLFLDELSEFARPALEALRQPLEDGRVAIARARHSAVYPARFMLLAATNPCPCGRGGEGCTCSEADLARHRRRLSGPLLDRIDMLAGLDRDRRGGRAPVFTSSARARDLVAAARERQAARHRGERSPLNARLDGRALRSHACLDDRGERLLRGASDAGLLSGRGQVRVLRVARTIADLDGSARVRARDVGAAIALRPDCAGFEASAAPGPASKSTRQPSGARA